MVQKRSTALLALPLAGSLLLAGCSGHAKKPPGSAATTSSTPPSSTSPSAPTTSPPAPTTTEATPTIPSAAKQHTKAGAEAFVRFYFDEVNRAWTTPDVGMLATYATPTCKSCAAAVSTARDLVTKKQRYDGDPASIRSVKAVLDTQTKNYKVQVVAIQEKRNIVDSSGKVVSTDPRIPTTVEATVQPRSNDGWIIQAIKLVS